MSTVRINMIYSAWQHRVAYTGNKCDRIHILISEFDWWGRCWRSHSPCVSSHQTVELKHTCRRYNLILIPVVWMCQWPIAWLFFLVDPIPKAKRQVNLGIFDLNVRLIFSIDWSCCLLGPMQSAPLCSCSFAFLYLRPSCLIAWWTISGCFSFCLSGWSQQFTRFSHQQDWTAILATIWGLNTRIVQRLWFHIVYTSYYSQLCGQSFQSAGDMRTCVWVNVWCAQSWAIN